MHPDQLAKNIWRVHTRIGTHDLFEGIWPLPEGVLINAYVVKGSRKTALIDFVCDWENGESDLTGQMEEIGVKVADVDYVVINHMEPDHTGALVDFRKKNKTAQIYCTKKAEPLVHHFLRVTDNIHVIEDGEELDLGDRTLVFYETPNIHWPETMMTFERESGILFSCDAFGSFGLFDHTFEDELSEDERELYRQEGERYYSNIVSTFSTFVQKGLAKLAPLPITMVAPSHGVLWRKDIERLFSWYGKLARYMNGPAEEEITLVWSSMYGNTESLLESVKAGVASEGVKLHIFRVPQTHASFILEYAWRSSGLIFGMPTYEYKMFPPMYHVLDILERSRVNKRKVMRFGSFGWSGGAQKQFDQFVETLKWDCVGTVEFQGAPTEEDQKKAFEYAAELARQVKAEVRT
ncbi:FprA family A-type flavoprotein [Parasphaerochaeta coccoides]|uniref:Beta-lactamase domain protein n=1 Tax=Parasphaerochaeta coccoides (strain ATCC BAA-1237 / DSM 17374 / SPN1) TaxID=760011 RepID=F4GM78_PARC1|nr:FprA family A-type flavoprotein [Parasphaerochaeta coccoides]AEC03054.1 beta-lactamase domain protein [Parasphaerochaeta coccoides DSM 17374]